MKTSCLNRLYYSADQRVPLFQLSRYYQKKMQTTQRSRLNQMTQRPPLPPNLKPHSNYLSPRVPYLSRTNSISKSFKKTSVEKSSRQKQIQQQLKYAKTGKVQTTFQTSLVHSENNLGLLLSHGPFEDSIATVNLTKARSKSKRGDRQQTRVENIDLPKPFDVLSGVSACNQHKYRQKNDEYYLYWKSKAHEYLESNMKLMEDVRRLNRQNQHLKQRIQNLQTSGINSEIVSQTIKKEQNKQNVYILQKMQEMQRELKRKQIVIKSYEEKVVELNSRVVGDNERTRLITKLKSEIDTLKTQLSYLSATDRKSYISAQKSTLQSKFKSAQRREESKGSNSGRR